MESIVITLTGFIIVSVFDALGSILSRLLKFKYVWLTLGSILIYGSVAFYSEKFGGLIIGVVSSGIVGVFDSTIGSLISRKLNAYIPEKDTVTMVITPKLIFVVGAFSSAIGLITILLFS